VVNGVVAAITIHKVAHVAIALEVRIAPLQMRVNSMCEACISICKLFQFLLPLINLQTYLTNNLFRSVLFFCIYKISHRQQQPYQVSLILSQLTLFHPHNFYLTHFYFFSVQ